MSKDGSRRGPKSRRAAVSYPFNDLEGTRWLQALTIGASLSGCAIRVGLTRDGGALAIGIYANDEYGTEYVRPDEDLAVACREISQEWHIPCAVWDDTAGQWIIMP